MDDLDIHGLFEGAAWMNLHVQGDGSCLPPPKTPSKDRVWVKSAYHLGPKLYSAANLTKNHQCFVQVRYNEHATYGNPRGPQARCNHPDCIKWQFTQARQMSLCKHIRSTVKWHAKLTRRAHRLSQGQLDVDVTHVDTEPRHMIAHNRWLMERYGSEFERTFGQRLGRYMHPLFGFEVIRFDAWVRPPEGQSCADTITERWGQDATDLIFSLMA